MIGQTISHYRILEKLGEGGMGIVYKAQDTKLDRIVALKFLPTNLLASQEEIVRFQQEAKALSALNHPHIATIFDVDQVNEERFIVLEYLPGGTLKSKLKHLQSSGKELSIMQIVEYGLQIAEGLSHAHQHGIVHRDVKTDNMMLTGDDKVKITDFGLAKLREGGQLTKAGSTVGTAAYMSPEQIRGETIDHRSDLFSLGIVLYELTTGHLPFRGEHEAALSYSIVNEEPTPLKSLRPGLPSSLESIIMRCLEKEREKRFQSAEEIVTEFHKLQQEISGYVSASRKPSKLWWGVTATVGVLLLIALYFLIPLKPAHDDTKSIAVLPFVNMSADREDEYFSDGITEELINALSKLEGLRVAARTSSFVFKGKTEDISKIGQQLHVSTVLEGSVRRAGNKLRITAQLINVTDGFHLWSETYEREMQDIFDIQSDVAQQIADALKAKLSPSEKKRIEKKPTVNLDAYTFYLQGRYFWNKRTEEGFRKAIEYFELAIQKDSNYAAAYAGVADCYNLLSAYSLMSPEESVIKSKAAALKALEIDNTLAEGHEALAHVGMLYEWNWSDVEREFKQAIALNPDYATAHQRYAIYLTAQGRMDEAIEEIKRAQELEPLSLIINTDVGLIAYLKGDYSRAIEECRKTLALDSDFTVAHFALGMIYEQLGKFTEAIAAFQNAVNLAKGNSIYLSALGHAYAAAGRRSEADRVLAELMSMSKQRYVSPYGIATVYTGMAEKERAIAWLQKASQDRSVWLIHLHIKVDPRLNGLRSDPRFIGLLKKMALEK